MVKNHTWHDIVKGMQKRVCPICSLIKKRTDQKISVLQYQHVSDVDFRKNFIDAKGFCAFHTEKFYEQGDALNHAIVYAHLLEVELKRLKQNAYQRKDKNHKPCMLCEGENASETIYLNLFEKAYREDEFKDAYQDEGLLCMTHYKAMLQLMKRRKNPELDSFKLVTTEKYEILEEDLKEIKRKNDFKYANEKLNIRETKAWQKARKLLIDQGQHRR